MINHCYVVSGEIKPLFSLSSQSTLTFTFIAFSFQTKTNNHILIELYLILTSLITTPTQSLRFDTLNIALSYNNSFYCEWYFYYWYFCTQKDHIICFNLGWSVKSDEVYWWGDSRRWIRYPYSKRWWDVPISYLMMRFPYSKILYLFLHISKDFEGQKYIDPEPLSFVENTYMDETI
jgi:hypothetical protein